MCVPAAEEPVATTPLAKAKLAVADTLSPVSTGPRSKGRTASNSMSFMEDGVAADLELRTSDGLKVQLDSRVLTYHSKAFGRMVSSSSFHSNSSDMKCMSVEEASDDLMPILSLLYKLDATWITVKNVRRLLHVCRKYDIHVVASQHLIPFITEHAAELVLPTSFGEWIRLAQSLVVDIPEAKRIEEAAVQRFAEGRVFRQQVADADLAHLAPEVIVRLMRAASAYDMDALSTWGCAAYRTELENERRQLRALERASS